MEQSAEQQVELIVRSLEEEGVPAAPVEEAVALATSHPEAIYDLAVAVMGRFPRGGTFLDAALSFLPNRLWPQLVERAIETLEESSDHNNEAADSVVAYASLQCPTALHPHLSRIFTLQPNAGSYYESYPWRESGESNVDDLLSIVESSASVDDRMRAWEAMIQTRHPIVIDYALSQVEVVRSPDRGLSHEEWLQAYLHQVGFDYLDGSLIRLCRDALYHLRFPDSYFEGEPRPPWLERIHPTWNLSSIDKAATIGGSSDNDCLCCKGKLHRLVLLDPVPAGLTIKGLDRLELAVCLSCLGWETEQLFYSHDEQGRPSNVGYDGPTVEPQFPVGPMKEADAGLAQTPQRWYWQDWALSNSRENLNRIGGEPCWVQDAEYPNCPCCQNTMRFLMQLDSDLPTADGTEWLWGSGGIGYGFWCDDCRISGFLWQCT